MPPDPGPAIDGWLHQVRGVEIVAPELRAEMRDRMSASFEQMRRDLNTSLYADGPYVSPPPLTMRQRARRFLDRAHDAWLVLTGRAEIGG